MTSVTTSNVYYLPARPAAEPAPRRQPKIGVWARVARTWWQLRFMVAEVLTIVRRRGRHLFRDEDALLAERFGDAADRSRPLPSGPARIIDFESARQRLRPHCA